MGKMKVAIIGTGGRSILYISAAKALSEQFEVVSMRFRTQEKADRFQASYGIPVTTSMEELYDSKPDFIVAVNNRPDVGSVAMDAIKHGFPVLAETPPAESMEEIRELWALTEKTGVKMLVAENYFEEPSFAAKLEAARRGYIGDVQTVTVSNTHQYHATSMMRLFLNAQYEPCTVFGRKFTLPLTVTEEKGGRPAKEGKTVDADRTHVIFEFANGKFGIYDFAIAQYWSMIRSRTFLVQGSRGEIKDDDIWYMDRDNNVLRGEFRTVTTSGGELVHICLGSEVLYSNPFVGTGVKSVGVASMMVNMKEYLETGRAKYPFRSGMQDTYLTQLILQAEANPYQLIKSEKMPWME